MPDGAQLKIEGQDALYKEYDAALADLDAAKNRWVRLSPAERIALLAGMKDGIMQVAGGWADASARARLPTNPSISVIACSIGTRATEAPINSTEPSAPASVAAR